MEANRMAEFEKESVQLEDYVGIYYSDELQTRYSFVLEDNQLIAKHSRLSDFKINPIAEDKFSGEAWFFGGVDIVRADDGSISGIKVSNGRITDLYFEKTE